MYLELLQRQMAVCSFEGAIRLTGLDQGYWNVVSIHGPREQKARLPHAKTLHYGCFDDVEEEQSTTYRSPRAEDIRAVFAFLDQLPSGPPREPLMIHCQQGISRSAAVALAWIFGQLPESADRCARAIDSVLTLRPRAKPNGLVLRLGLAQFLPILEAKQLAQGILEDPRLQRNCFLAPETEAEEFNG